MMCDTVTDTTGSLYTSHTTTTTTSVQVVVDVQYTCRLCGVSLRNGKAGRLQNTRALFGTKKDTIKKKNQPTKQPLWRRFYSVGVSLVDRPGLSPRICNHCYAKLERVEKCWPTLTRWRVEHNDQARCQASYDTAAVEEHISEEERRAMVDSGINPSECLPINRSEGLPTVSLSEGAPIDPFKALKRNHPAPRLSNTEVFIQYPSKKRVRLQCDPDVSGIIESLAKGKWRRAAKQMLLHPYLVEELKPGFLQIVDGECRVLCDHKQSFVLRRCPADQFRMFSFAALDGDLKRLAPFLSSVFSTITRNRSQLMACAAAAIALRGRENRLSAFSYYVNNVLQFAGARKSVFERLSKLGITTSHSCAVRYKFDFRRRGYLAGKTKTDKLAAGGGVD